MAIRGHNSGALRPPLTEIEPENREDLERVLAELDEPTREEATEAV
jgi:4-hydroxy-tetrahydrodipicolinate synthase